MSSLAPAAPTSKGMLWTGRILTGLIVVWMLFGISYGFLKPQESLKAMRDMGYPESASMPITVALLVSTALYAIPRTSVFGAILLTGYLGGAIATHVRLGQPIFVVPLLVAIVVWVGIYLREGRLRQVLPWRS
jgi:hypothetical protein